MIGIKVLSTNRSDGLLTVKDKIDKNLGIYIYSIHIQNSWEIRKMLIHARGVFTVLSNFRFIKLCFQF